MANDSSNPSELPKSPSEHPPGGPSSSREYDGAKEKLVVLATFSSSPDAHQLRNELENNGIAAHVANETTTSIFGNTMFGQNSAFWIEVLVKKSDSERALQIKERHFANDAADIPEWICECGETVDAGFSVCWNCEATFQNPNLG